MCRWGGDVKPYYTIPIPLQMLLMMMMMMMMMMMVVVVVVVMLMNYVVACTGSAVMNAMRK